MAEGSKRRKPFKAIVDYWTEYYAGGRLGLCSLCGNLELLIPEAGRFLQQVSILENLIFVFVLMDKS